MAKKRGDGPNKSQLIREYKDANPDAEPRDIAKALEETHGLELKANYVSSVLFNQKKKSGKPSGKGRGRPKSSKSTAAKASKGAKKPAPAPVANDGQVSTAALKKVKKLVQEVGGVGEAREILNVLADILD